MTDTLASGAKSVNWRFFRGKLFWHPPFPTSWLRLGQQRPRLGAQPRDLCTQPLTAWPSGPPGTALPSPNPSAVLGGPVS